jgi:7-carboxy-7-deazaguanine synthase
MIARGIHELAAVLRQNGFHITIETAGTVPPAGIPCDLVSVSPKFSNSTPSSEKAGESWVRRHEETRWQPDILREWLAYPEVQCKLVVASETEARESLDLVQETFPNLPPEKIFLMPEGTDADTLRSRAWLVDFCLRGGYRFCDRLHIHLFGNTKGT